VRPTAGLLASPGSGARHHQRLHAPGTRGLCSGATHTSPVPALPSPPPAPLPKGAVAIQPVTNQHSMATHAKHGFRVPAQFHAAQLSPVPKTYRGGLADSSWRAAMEEEHAALLQNHTWDLVPRPPHANVVTGSGFSSTSSMQTRHWSGTRRAGFFGASPNAQVWISLRRSVLW
jgi:hypothetical protein